MRIDTVKTQAKTPTWSISLDRIVVGKIVQGGDGFRYFPKGLKTGGELYDSLPACVESLREQA